MTKRSKKIIKAITLLLSTLFIGLIAFILYETKDEINATPENVTERLNSYHNPSKMGGFAVSVFTADSVIHASGIGLADVANNVPYTTKTQQYVASVSKTTIGIALLKAEELGLLTMDDPVNKHLSFVVKNPDFSAFDITLRHLATHTSSFDYNEEVVESIYIDAADESLSLETFMFDYFRDGKYGEVLFTKHEPGTNFNYSNIGSGLAAYVVERVSGMSFSEFTHTHIFEPLEMNNTFWFASSGDSSTQTKHYEPAEDTIKEVENRGIILYPVRDLYTNLEDLTTYCQSIMSQNQQLLGQEAFEKMVRPQLTNSVPNQFVDNQAIFFMIDRNQYGITYQLTGMNGGDYCINTMMWYDPVTGIGYIFIGNTGSSARSKVNSIFISRTLVSLGEDYLRKNSSFGDRIKYRWHNIYSRINGLF